MIVARHLVSTINAQRYAQPTWYVAGTSLDAMALPGAVSVFVDTSRIPHDQWATFQPRDGAEVVFIYSEVGRARDIAADVFSITFLGPTGFALDSVFGGLGQRFARGAFQRISNLPRDASRFLRKQIANGLGGSVGVGGGTSPNYADTKASNSATIGSMIPVAYGEFEAGGFVLQQNIVGTVSSRGKNAVTYRLLVALSHGPLQQIGVGSVVYTTDQDNLTGSALPSGLTLDGREVSTFRDVSVSLRTGNANQTIMPGFDSNRVQYGYAVALNRGIVFEHVTRDPVTNIALNLTFPRGLVRNRSDGDAESYWVDIKIDVYTLDGTPVFNETRRVLGRFDANTTITLDYPGNEMDRYRITVERVAEKGTGIRNRDEDEGDANRFYTPFVSSISEENPFAPAYRGLAVLGITVRATDELQSLPVVRCKVRGRRVFDPRVTTVDVTGATNASPIVLTTDGAHGIASGSEVMVQGVGGNTAANGRWEVTAPTSSTLSLVRSVGNGTYTSGGSVSPLAWSRNNALIATDLATNPEYGGGDRLSLSDVLLDELEDAADFCDELVPEFTGSGDTEPRFEFDGVVDEVLGLWPWINRILGNARIVPTRIGDRVGFAVLDVKPTSQIFSPANVLAPGVETSWASANAKPNEYQMTYRDRTSWENETVASRSSEIAPGIRRTPEDADGFGITRRTEAQRRVEYLLREARIVDSAVSLQTGLDALACVPGSVVEVFADAMAGRIAASTSGSRTLDRSVTFASGVVYIYTERDDDGTLTDIQFTASGTTATLNLTGLPSGDAAGRMWGIRRADEQAERYLFIRSSKVSDGVRQIECIKYGGAELYNDASGPSASGVYTPVRPAPPADVDDLAVTAEAFLRDGVSAVSLSWTAGGAAQRIDIYARSLVGGTFRIAGSVAGSATTAAVEIAGQFGERFEFAVVGVGAFDRQASLGALTAGALVQYTLRRYDDDAVVAEFPEPATALVLTPGTGTAATLSWTHSSDADGYEVIVGLWHGGMRIADTASNSVPVVRNALPFGFGVRAYRDVTNGVGGTTRFYSELFPRIASTEAVPAGYNIGASGTTERFDDQDEYLNARRIRWQFGSIDGIAVLQADNRLDVVYTTNAIDRGSAAVRFVSTDARCTTFQLGPGENFFSSSQGVAFSGLVHRDYIDCRVFLLHSLDNVTFTEMEITGLLQTDIIAASARYYKLRVLASVLDGRPVYPSDCVVLIERAALRITNPT